jgi:hypothetical protein
MVLSSAVVWEHALAFAGKNTSGGLFTHPEDRLAAAFQR